MTTHPKKLQVTKEQAVAHGMAILGLGPVKVVNVRYSFLNHPDQPKVAGTVDESIAGGYQLKSRVEQPASFVPQESCHYQGSTELTFVKAQEPPGSYCTACGISMPLDDRACGGCGAARPRRASGRGGTTADDGAGVGW